MNSLDRRIEEIKQADEQAASEHLWYLRCDDVRKRERQRNYEAIKQAVESGIERVNVELPGRKLEFIENPAWFFTVRYPSPLGATATATMSQDGAVIDIEVQHHRTGVTSRNVVQVEVKGDDTCFTSREGRFLTAAEVANIIVTKCL
jgi:hypothetical protein